MTAKSTPDASPLGNPQEMGIKQQALVKQQINDIVEFEKEIANITKSQAERRQDTKTYRNSSLAQLKVKADFLDWENYFNKAFQYHLEKNLEPEYQDVTYAEEYIGNYLISLQN